MKKLFVIAAMAATLMACNKTDNNPLLADMGTPYGVPAFDKIQLSDYAPAYEEAFRQQEEALSAIANNEEAPTFENTIVAIDGLTAQVDKLNGVFFNLLETDGTDEMNELAEVLSQKLSVANDNMLLNEALFARVKAVYEQREELNLDVEDARLLEVIYRQFVMNGANLSDEAKARLREINQELASLSLRFGRNVVSETNACKRFVTDESELAGLPEGAKTAAAEEAAAAGHEGEWLFVPKRTSFTPVLQYCENRKLREMLLMDYTTRGNHDNANDNKVVINKTMYLRIEKAKLFGYDNAADYILQDAMAHDGKTARNFLQTVWEPSLAAAKREAAALQVLLDEDIKAGKVIVEKAEDAKLQPWDWWYYAEKLRKAQYDLDEEQIKPYLELSNVRKGAFDLATRLYGIQFEKLENMPIYHPDVEVFKLTDANGELLGIFYTDYFPRDTKRPGAWMNDICIQHIDAEGINHRPVIVNVGNFNKPTGNQPALLSMDDVETLFHEFGHALHGFFSQCHYSTLHGTNVSRDFVELPSQLMENWCYEPEVMRTYARHYETGEVIPDELIERINNAGKFNQGFVETELLSASILDMDYHMISYDEMQKAIAAATDSTWLDVNAFEAASMAKMQMLPEIIVRYRSTFYNHIFTTGYEAGYYSYTWAAVLDSDAFHAFKETGDVFDKETATRLREEVLSKGNTADPAVLYQRFRGKQANPKYLLEKKGLL